MEGINPLVVFLSIVFFACWNLLMVQYQFIFVPQEGFLEVRKIYRHHVLQYHVALLTYEPYAIIM